MRIPDTRTDATRPYDHAGYRLERSLLLTVMSDAAADSDNGPQKQCRICLDGPEVEGELGRLIRPCLCRGSISVEHPPCSRMSRSLSPPPSAVCAC